MGRPDGFELIEAGAGDGTLLRALLPELADLGPAGHRGRTQRRALVRRSATIDGVEVREHDARCTATPALVLAHELLDNLPFRRLRSTDDGPREVTSVSSTAGSSRCSSRSSRPAPPTDRRGRETVVPTGAASFVVEALTGPAPRALLAIDYGSDRGAGGPAHGYASHRVVEDLLGIAGRPPTSPQGWTSGSSPRRHGAAGCMRSRRSPSTTALIALGFEDWLRTELERQRDLLDTGRGADAVRAWGGRSRAAMLADPAGLGRFRWFVAATPDVAEPTWLRAAREHRSLAEA